MMMMMMAMAMAMAMAMMVVIPETIPASVTVNTSHLDSPISSALKLRQLIYYPVRDMYDKPLRILLLK